MEQKKKALGRGLEELFSTEVLDFDTFDSGLAFPYFSADVVPSAL